MITEVLLFILASVVLVKSAQHAVKAISNLAHWLKLTEFVTSFFLVAIVSALPEGFIALLGAAEGYPNLAVGTLLGGNLADLTLIFGLIALVGMPIRVTREIIKRDFYFVGLLMLPIILGFNGVLSRLDGIILIIAGVWFLWTLLKERRYFSKIHVNGNQALKHAGIFLLSILFMLLASHFIIDSASSIAAGLGVPTLIIGMVLVALGTTLPEFTFSLQSIKKGHDGLAVGDILGTVVIDGTILIGLVALINPVPVDLFIWSIVGVFTALAIVFSLLFMRTDGVLNKTEAMALVFFYVGFVVVQVLVG